MTTPVKIDYTSFSYDEIRAKLVDYLKESDTFRNIDTNGSYMGTLIGVLAYIGQLNNFYINASVNETFNPSARLYKNLNRLGQLVGYDAKGYLSATIDIVMKLTNEYTYSNVGNYFSIPMFSRFPVDVQTNSGENIFFVNNNTLSYTVKGAGISALSGQDLLFKPKWSETTGTKFSVDDYSFSTGQVVLSSGITPYQSFAIYASEENPATFIDASGATHQFTSTIQTSDDVSTQLSNGVIYGIFIDYSGATPYLTVASVGSSPEQEKEICRVQYNSATKTIEFHSNFSDGKFYLGRLGMYNMEQKVLYFDTPTGSNTFSRLTNDGSKVTITPVWDDNDVYLTKLTLSTPSYTSDALSFKVLIDGKIYEFSPNITISTDTFDRNAFKAGEAHNVILKILETSSEDLDSYSGINGSNASLKITTDEPGHKEVVIATIDAEDVVASVAGSIYGDIIPTDAEISTFTLVDISETILLKDLKQGSVVTSTVASDITVDDGVTNTLDLEIVDESKLIINAEKVSTDNIRVFVQLENNEWEEWVSLANTFKEEVDGESKVFFCRVNADEKIEITFGDDVFGKNPFGSRIQIISLQTVGSEGNVASDSFGNDIIVNAFSDANIELKTNQYFDEGVTSTSDLQDNESNSVLFTFKQKLYASGGDDIEDKEEVRNNTVRTVRMQDRVVTERNYKDFVLANFGNIVVDAVAYNYTQMLDDEILREDFDESKYFFNHIFVYAVSARENSLTRTQKNVIIKALDSEYSKLASIQNEILDVSMVPVDVAVRYKKTSTTNLSDSNIETSLRNVITLWFDRTSHTIGETVYHSELLNKILDVEGIQSAELLLKPNRRLTGAEPNYVSADYDVSVGLSDYATINELSLKKLQNYNILVIKGIMKSFQPLFSYELLSSDGYISQNYDYALNVLLQKNEFPILDDIILKSEIGKIKA